MQQDPPSKHISRIKLQRLRLSELVAQDEPLLHSDLVALLPPDAAASVLDRAHLRRFEAGTVVFREGDAGSTLFFVLRGEVQLSCESAQVVTCVRGEVFGEAELLRPGPRSFTAHATVELEVAEIEREWLTALGATGRPLALRLEAIRKERQSARSELDDFLKRW